jgi:hypothetical protein
VFIVVVSVFGVLFFTFRLSSLLIFVK